MRKFSLQGAFKDSFSKLFEQPVVTQYIIGFLIVLKKLINQICVDGHSSPFELVSLYCSMTVYTKDLTLSERFSSLS